MGTQARHSVWGRRAQELWKMRAAPQGLSEGRKLSVEVLFF